MRPVRGGRTFEAVSASIVAHVILLSALLAHAPLLRIPEQASGPPLPVIPVLLLPRTPPPAAVPSGPPTPVRLHRRPQRMAPQEVEELPVAPLVAPEIEVPPQPEVEGPRFIVPPQQRPQDDAISANVRNALRGSLVGCANAAALGYTREERERCEDRLSAGAKQAAFPGLGMEADKNSDLARAAARKEAYRRYRDAGVPPGTAGGVGDSGQPWKVVIPPTGP